MENENLDKCSSFEETLMWTSYRYCIGRKTYVTSLAGEIAQHYYKRMDDDMLEFTAKDIRKEIMDKLQWLPFSLRIYRHYDADEFNPIEVLMEFFERYDVNTYEDMITYCKVQYDVNNDTYEFEKKEPTIKSYFSLSDIDELLPWEKLAACFDKKNHKMVTVEYDGKTETIECFKSWTRKTIPLDDPIYVRIADFGWKPIWVSVDDYVKDGNYCGYINEDCIKEIK